MAIPTAFEDQQVAQLESDWDHLHDLDRAAAVANIRRSGLSIRKIAHRLGRSEPSLRYLLVALLAPPADQAAARQGTISTSELVRCARNEVQRQKARDSEARQGEHKRKAVATAKAIRDWLLQEHLHGSIGEAIALEARTMLVNDAQAGRLPHFDPHVIRPAAEWIERCRPQTPVQDEASHIDWYATRLARWTVCLTRHAEIAIDALAIEGRL